MSAVDIKSGVTPINGIAHLQSEIIFDLDCAL